MAITGALYSEASGRMGGPKVIKINYFTTNCDVAGENRPTGASLIIEQ